MDYLRRCSMNCGEWAMWHVVQVLFWRKEEETLIGTLEVFHIIVNLLGNLLFPLPLEGQTEDKCLIIAAFDTDAAGGQQYIKTCDIKW